MSEYKTNHITMDTSKDLRDNLVGQGYPVEFTTYDHVLKQTSAF